MGFVTCGDCSLLAQIKRVKEGYSVVPIKFVGISMWK